MPAIQGEGLRRSKTGCGAPGGKLAGKLGKATDTGCQGAKKNEKFMGGGRQAKKRKTKGPDQKLLRENSLNSGLAKEKNLLSTDGLPIKGTAAKLILAAPWGAQARVPREKLSR